MASYGTQGVKEQVKIRIAAAASCSWSIGELLKSRYISRGTKIQAYKTIVQPVATYSMVTNLRDLEINKRIGTNAVSF